MINAKLLTALIFVSLSFATASPADDAREQAACIVAQIQRAEGIGWPDFAAAEGS